MHQQRRQISRTCCNLNMEVVGVSTWVGDAVDSQVHVERWAIMIKKCILFKDKVKVNTTLCCNFPF
jgi:hypothetical protein